MMLPAKNCNTLAAKKHSSAWNNPQRHVFQTKFSLVLSSITLVGFLVLSILFHQDSGDAVHAAASKNRWLNEDDGNNQDNDEQDYSSYSCNLLYSVTPERGEAQCRFAQECNQGAGLWAPFVYCRHGLSFTAWMVLLSPIMALWLVLLFRLLGSTAEDYFSPSLEMFSLELGLPPRFAGVTLLALGNGAADVSATVSAITSDPEHGYLLSLGALTGAAMFISSVISAAVVLVAGGVPCRGALVRDVAALGLSVMLVWYELGGASPEQGGVVGPETVTLFLSLYAVFVLLVLCADVYHRAVVLPRKRARAQDLERQRQLREQELHEQEMAQQHEPQQQNGGSSGESDGSPGQTDPMLQQQSQTQEQLSDEPQDQQPQSQPQRKNPFSNVLTAFSNYDNDEAADQGWIGSTGGQSQVPQPQQLGVDSEELAQDRPILLHGAHGILNTPQHHTPGTGAEAHAAAVGAADGTDPETEGTAYAMLEDAGVVMDRTCLHDPGSGHQGQDTIPQSWSHAWQMNRKELHKHAEEVWDDIAYNGDIDMVTKFLLICEVPFLVLRKATVPIPCEGYYVRALVALSVAISPLWMGLYLWHGMDVVVWNRVWFWSYWAIALVSAAALMRFAPGGDGGSLSLWVSTPVALYGFCVAATWIDTVADALVSLLDFIGIVLRIPGPVVGLTILAWGNSMADLSADITMARKGLANMAMTACFAGPFFNILVGLGLGFSSLSAQTGQAEHAVHLQPSISAGFWFLAVNSVVILATGLCLGTGKIPKKYGYIAITLYSIYLIASIVLEYTRSGDNHQE